MKYPKRHDSSESKEKRKELRKSLTPAEAFLWKQLKGSKPDGKKFRRQRGFDRYIGNYSPAA